MLRATKMAELQSFAPGEPIISQGAEAEMFYIMTKGEAEVYLDRPNGREVLVDRLNPGQYFGEMALFSGGTRSAFVRASLGHPVEALSLDRKAFADLLNSSTEMYEEIQRSVSHREQVLANAQQM